MSNAVEIAVNTYIGLVSEPDPAVRSKMIEACFSANGRLVTRSREVRGRAALADELTQFHADPQFVGVRLLSAVDARGTTFRFRSAVDRRDGTSLEFFDAGEIDVDGRISVILTFAGALGDSLA